MKSQFLTIFLNNRNPFPIERRLIGLFRKKLTIRQRLLDAWRLCRCHNPASRYAPSAKGFI